MRTLEREIQRVVGERAMLPKNQAAELAAALLSVVREMDGKDPNTVAYIFGQVTRMLRYFQFRVAWHLRSGLTVWIELRPQPEPESAPEPEPIEEES